MLEELINLSKGNPGAMSCLMGMLGHKDSSIVVAGMYITTRIKELNIVGTDLYVLYSDICNKDYLLMKHVLKTAPDDKLQEACSKQDYSGREILKEYVDSYEV